MPGRTAIRPLSASFGKNLGSKFHWKRWLSCLRPNEPATNSSGFTAERTKARFNSIEARLKPDDFFRRRSSMIGSKPGHEILRPDSWNVGKSGAKKILSAGDGAMSILCVAWGRGQGRCL